MRQKNAPPEAVRLGTATVHSHSCSDVAYGVAVRRPGGGCVAGPARGCCCGGSLHMEALKAEIERKRKTHTKLRPETGGKV